MNAVAIKNYVTQKMMESVINNKDDLDYYRSVYRLINDRLATPIPFTQEYNIEGHALYYCCPSCHKFYGMKEADPIIKGPHVCRACGQVFSSIQLCDGEELMFSSAKSKGR